MSLSVPFYVREFNAASMAEAIHKADQALREDGVTVAVWRNRVESLDDHENKVRNIAIRNILSACHHRLPCISDYSDFQMLDYRLDSPIPEVYSKRNNPNFVTTDFSFVDYVPLTSKDIDALRYNFGSVTGGIRRERGYNNIETHTDPTYINGAIDSQKSFYGVHTRFIENMKGSPTAFACDDAGNDVYVLPQGAGAFFLTDGYLEKAAYHMATHDEGKLRLLQIIDLFPR